MDEAIADRDASVDALGERVASARLRVKVQDAAIEARDQRLKIATRKLDELEGVANWLAKRVVERDRELRRLRAEVARLGGEPLSRLAAEIQAPPEAREVRVARVSPAAASANGNGGASAADLFEGLVEVEIGPLADFSQLVGFEDAAGGIAATAEISVKRFTRGRATVAMRLTEPVALLRELEERAPFGFRVRDQRPGHVVLDVGE